MKKFLIIILLIAVQLIASGWKFDYRSHGISTYHKSNAKNPHETYMAVGFVEAPLELIGLILLDVNNHYTWIAGIKYSKIVKLLYGDYRNLSKMKKGGFMQYYVVDTPWPVQNRDTIIKTDFKINWNLGSLAVTCKGINRRDILKNKKYFRMNKILIYWKCFKVKKNLTKVIYIMKSNPGGNIPAVFANNATKSLPYKTIINLRKECLKKKHLKKYRKLFKD